MLFNSPEYIFLFVPLVFLLYAMSGMLAGRRAQIVVLLLSSLAFYAWWSVSFLGLLILSIVANYSLGHVVSRLHGTARRAMLIAMIIGNLTPLFIFKYFNFAMENLSGLLGHVRYLDVAIPLGISFYTFQQIAYVVDVFRGGEESPDFLRYALFVTFFPHLIAGPIVHHKYMIPQFRYGRMARIFSFDIATGLTIFAIGLFKKVILADNISRFVDPFYDTAMHGHPVSFLASWVAAFATGLQIYFDFSGYSDMAIGAARIFGVRLPINFNSPFKAITTIEFWRRWHISMTRFFNEYVYNPVALYMTRSALTREYGSVLTFFFCILVPTVLTTVIIGLWHGAGWNYIFFGLVQGSLLTIAHLWRAQRRVSLSVVPSWLLTIIPTMASFVYFRAPNLETAHHILSAMSGWSGIVLSPKYAAMFPSLWKHLSAAGVPVVVTSEGSGIDVVQGVLRVGGAMGFCLIFPNSVQIMRRYSPVIDWRTGYRNIAPRMRWLAWRPSAITAVGAGLILGVLPFIGTIKEFIYFKF